MKTEIFEKKQENEPRLVNSIFNNLSIEEMNLIRGGEDGGGKGNTGSGNGEEE